ncbi:uncharacterized protein CELE_K12H4.6 [Caenorhabditis elegans]|uniref:Uncharacterized protein K12H4.6 n=1 Tax=Caenorhabditis elegans TaxID=6239 RepID=YM66_CAEEL|nr:Uncharacterized protein CELE_K12H4.6 [Caenorhabditis elegans]P34527.2 RecName: Full=Uncharacterized protein K12H4.6 [Caenorhabditis elegans]CCD71201.1 Uncharacterized protein CELE_K12H4.6 [Caenorhabditis elegans]|eukprot:NP_498753.2 Uncharacterized protein CELE_K12H4.6 [Caenorhabditis elegans]
MPQSKQQFKRQGARQRDSKGKFVKARTGMATAPPAAVSTAAPTASTMTPTGSSTTATIGGATTGASTTTAVTGCGCNCCSH